ncbi:glycosyl transferase [Stenotrophomonas sp. SPM]|uniref:glycosyltransferase n=1 Tax=Stenotrophomonas sp. SPM TaxID=2170735 RepID=UPI000DE767E0|nr:glycosyltransferase [Stenotrophomonas sp. SPM]PWB27736.1 glycosyl transferase [Stenotrophomonas sp. SPM]
MARVLVVLAYFKGAEWIEEQVRSVLAQEGVEVRLIVFDDCPASCLAAEASVGSIDPRVKVCNRRTESGGAGQNFLKAIQDVRGESFDFLSFCDQDDVWDATKLSRAIDALRSEGAVGYSSAVRAVWPDGTSKALVQNAVETDMDFLFEGAGQGCTFVIDRDFAMRLADIVEEHSDAVSGLHYHDWFIYSMSRALGKKWAFDPSSSMMYRQHQSNDTGARASFGGVMSRIVKIRDGWYRSQVASIIEIVKRVGLNSVPSDLLKVYESPATVVRRIWLARILFARGRRRFTDRGVLAVSALLGWI